MFDTSIMSDTLIVSLENLNNTIRLCIQNRTYTVCVCVVFRQYAVRRLIGLIESQTRLLVAYPAL